MCRQEDTKRTNTSAGGESLKCNFIVGWNYFGLDKASLECRRWCLESFLCRRKALEWKLWEENFANKRARLVDLFFNNQNRTLA